MSEQTNTFEHDETYITAYLLGELEGDELREFEQTIEADEALRAEVEAQRAVIDALQSELSSEKAPGLTDEQREMISRGEPKHVPLVSSIRPLWVGLGLATAAAIALMFVLPFFGESRSRFAINQEDESSVSSFSEKAVDAPTGAEGEFKDLPKKLESRRAGKTSTIRDRTDRVEAEESPEATPSPAAASGLYDISESNEGVRSDTLALSRGVPKEESSRGVTAGEAGMSIRSKLNEPAPRTAPAPPPPPRRPSIRAESPAASAQSTYAAEHGDRQFKLIDDADELARLLGSALGGHAGHDQRPRDEFPSRVVDREVYAPLVDNPFIRAFDEPISTFSIDVDTASYSNVRRMINAGSLPPKDAVRIEEMINYFDYHYEPASGEHPFSVTTEISAAPWNPDNRLMRIGLKAREVDPDMRPATSLVFLIDVSGSMGKLNKLPLVKQSLKLMIDNLTADDRIGIVTYAGQAGLALDSTFCDEREAIIGAIDRLHAGGSTNGAGGIVMAYDLAREHFIEGGVNRVILCTDGDFNVGVTSQGDLDRLIEEQRTSGVFLSVLGFGTGNFQDAKMESLSNKGNGTFAYIDSLEEAQRVLGRDIAGTLVTVAKDVKLQIDFNPKIVGAYRLVGYANRMLAPEDFKNDAIDAGDIGAGHTVTALYEIIPAQRLEQLAQEKEQLIARRKEIETFRTTADLTEEGDEELVQEAQEIDRRLGIVFAGAPVDPDADVEESKYFKRADAIQLLESDEFCSVRVRYKQPDEDESTKFTYSVIDEGASLAEASDDLRLAAAVAAFGMALRDSHYRGEATFDLALKLAQPHSSAAQLLEDFVHYTTIARPDLAGDSLEALLDLGLTPEELKALATQTIDAERLSFALVRGARIDELTDEVERFHAVLGRAVVTDSLRDKSTVQPTDDRTEFIELIRKAKALAGE